MQLVRGFNYSKLLNNDPRFVCPLSKNIFKYPIMFCGHFFEKSSVKEYVRRWSVHPVTKERIEYSDCKFRLSDWKMKETLKYKDRIYSSCIEEIAFLLENAPSKPGQKKVIFRMVELLLDRALQMKPFDQDTFVLGCKVYRHILNDHISTSFSISKELLLFFKLLTKVNPEFLDEEKTLLYYRFCLITNQKLPSFVHRKVTDLFFNKKEYEICFLILLRGANQKSTLAYKSKKMIPILKTYMFKFGEKNENKYAVRIAIQIANIYGKKKRYEKELEILKFAMSLDCEEYNDIVIKLVEEAEYQIKKEKMNKKELEKVEREIMVKKLNKMKFMELIMTQKLEEDKRMGRK